MKTTRDRLAGDYVKRVRAALGDLPRDRRRAVLEDVRGRIAQLDPGGDAELRALLDRLGDPLDIAAAERKRVGPRPQRRRETTAIILLLLGGFAVLVGWIGGVVLLWRSEVWTTRDKLLGTLVVPGGPALVPFLWLLYTVSRSTGPDCLVTAEGSTCGVTRGGGVNVGWAVAVSVVLVLAPVATSVYLAWRMQRNAGA